MGFLSLYIGAFVSAFKDRVIGRRFFDLATPDPEFLGFAVHPEDQLPGRPVEGEIDIFHFFTRGLFLTEAQQEGWWGRGEEIYDYLKANNLPVLGPNVAQFFLKNQHLIPMELRGKGLLVFWGKVYRASNGSRLVRCLSWSGEEWTWAADWLDDPNWSASDRAVVLAS